MSEIVPHSAFAGIHSADASDAGVVCRDLDGTAFATVVARKGRTDAVVRSAELAFAVDLPLAPRMCGTPAFAFVGIGPGSWLAVSASIAPKDLLERLNSDFDGLAAISDQSGGYAALRLSGDKIRSALAKAVPIDLHPDAFPVGQAATTAVAHMGATLWREGDDDAGAVFTVVMFRSHAHSFWRWLDASAAEFGIRFVPAGDGHAA